MKKNTFRHTGEPLLLTAWMFVSCLSAAAAAVKGLYVCMGLSVLLALGAAFAAYRYMTRSSRSMSDFIRSVRNSDFQDFTDSSDDRIPKGLADEMKEAAGYFGTRLRDKESRLQYFQALANHIDTAVIVYTRQGAVEWMNSAASRLVSSAVMFPKTIEALRPFHPQLPDMLLSLKPDTLKVLQVRQQDEMTQYAVSGIEFVLQGRRLTIASLKNIHSALDSQETLAWQKLIRVLTHEIMNSITPVVSLTELLNRQVAQLEGSDEDKEDIRQMLATIARRSKALTHFVSSYREVSHLPQPVLQPVDTAELTMDIAGFVRNDRDDLNVTVPPARLTILADKEQIEQVLINLIKNARENGATRITLSSGVNPAGRTYVRVSDNGSGIEPEVQERIFIPFFTTKAGGSGIGLTLSRQIMLQHNGTISVHSIPGKGSEFTLVFQ